MYIVFTLLGFTVCLIIGFELGRKQPPLNIQFDYEKSKRDLDFYKGRCDTLLREMIAVTFELDRHKYSGSVSSRELQNCADRLRMAHIQATTEIEKLKINKGHK